MKKIFTQSTLAPFLCWIIFSTGALAQVTYTYPLNTDFHGLPYTAPDLIQIQNNNGLAGSFVQRTVPSSTCGQQGTAHGYFYEDDAGLQFNNPAGFINQSYSIAFNLQVDEFISPPAWVRIMSFTHIDDVGVYIKLTGAPTNGTLEFWPYGTVGTYDFFTTNNFYQMILVRNDSGMIRIYVNGSEFATYDDSESQKYVPQPPNNYIIWFRDDPSVLANEASPGFVSDIRIANFAWTPQKVQEVWQNFCSSLLNVPFTTASSFRVYPNPAREKLNLEIPSNIESCSVSIYDLTGQTLFTRTCSSGRSEFDLARFTPGYYFLRVRNNTMIQTFRFTKL
jgi:hypothetical protein